VCICWFTLHNCVTVHGTKNINVLICVRCVFVYTHTLSHPPPHFFGKGSHLFETYKSKGRDVLCDFQTGGYVECLQGNEGLC